MESIVNQSFKDIEIICVNDGSTDNSLEILKRYEELDGRVSVFTQENKGAGAARNLGLSHANGEYVYFMDSDDYLELTALEELYQISEENQTDFIIFKLINYNDGEDETFTTSYHEMPILKKRVGNKLFNYRDLGIHVFYLSVNPQGKFFRKSSISHLKFPENVFFEDNVFFMEAIFDAERVLFYDKHLCYHRIRKDSMMGSSSLKHIDVIHVLNMLFDITKERNLFESYKYPLYNRKMQNSFARFSNLNEEFKGEFFKELKKDFISHQEEYEADDDFLKVLTPKAEFIFYRAISSENYREFELEVNLFDAENRKKELEKSLSDSQEQIGKLEKTNKSLEKEIKRKKKENENLKSSKSSKFGNFIKRIK